MRTLFLDRDGVINERIVNGYVTSIDKFKFLPGVLEAFAILSKKYDLIIVVSNQQGIGKGLFSVDDLFEVHSYMLDEINKAGGRVDRIYFCGDLKSTNSFNRKPNIGMALQAKKDFDTIDFYDSVMVGDSMSDIVFGNKLGMKTVFLYDTNGDVLSNKIKEISTFIYPNLLAFAESQIK